MTVLIFIEGNIGAGKSTIISKLRTNDIDVIIEPLNEWQNLKDSNNKNILDHFYTDMKKYSYSFQSNAFLSRIKTLYSMNKEKDIILVERSVFSDKYIFAQNCKNVGIMNEIEWILYNNWFDWMVTKAFEDLGVKTIGYIYLRCEPEVCHKRLTLRNRKEEKKVSLDYIKDLHKLHEEWLNKDRDDVFVFDNNKDTEYDHKIIRFVHEEIRNFSKLLKSKK